ncbi:uncharacterized protein LOC131672183 [Phymastichus coffea]|uniref:uncharacterized protein LOC131672183 n=1 Tax=Phymastichus coffea TaxID=108790 RepID=UPI00273CA96A|nr:uncharacterized protein LOC131672183 [Phymastichus coffea]
MSPKDKSKKLSGMDFNVLLVAIKHCSVDKLSIKSTAAMYAISRTTLQRYVKKVEEHFEDIETVEDDALLDFLRACNKHVPSNQVFSTAQENDLVTYILKCSNHYYGLSINEVRELAYQFAVKLGVDFPNSWNKDEKAGMEWYKKFRRRHPQLTLRTPEQTSLNRVKAFCTTKVQKFFDQLGAMYDEHHFPATHVYNMDESGFSTVPTKIGRVITLKGTRRVGKVEAAERGTMITMALTVDANGNSLPPFFLYPRKNMQSCYLDNATSGTDALANGSGWMDQPSFLRYMRHFIAFAKPTPASPVLLLLDNHSSHLSVEALDLAVENGVHILSFPPHCSHRLQPLDVSVFGPVKTFYKLQCSAWQKNNANKGLEIRHLASLICKALDLALTPKTIKSGFRATGIMPFDPDIFSEADYVKDVGQTPVPSTSTSRATSVSNLSILDDVGPLRGATPKKPLNRGRKPMESSILTSPDVLSGFKRKEAERNAKQAAKESTASKRAKLTPGKRTNPTS